MCVTIRNSVHGVLLLPSLKKQRELIQGPIKLSFPNQPWFCAIQSRFPKTFWSFSNDTVVTGSSLSSWKLLLLVYCFTSSFHLHVNIFLHYLHRFTTYSNSDRLCKWPDCRPSSGLQRHPSLAPFSSLMNFNRPFPRVPGVLHLDTAFP